LFETKNKGKKMEEVPQKKLRYPPSLIQSIGIQEGRTSSLWIDLKHMREDGAA